MQAPPTGPANTTSPAPMADTTWPGRVAYSRPGGCRRRRGRRRPELVDHRGVDRRDVEEKASARAMNTGPPWGNAGEAEVRLPRTRSSQWPGNASSAGVARHGVDQAAGDRAGLTDAREVAAHDAHAEVSAAEQATEVRPRSRSVFAAVQPTWMFPICSVDPSPLTGPSTWGLSGPSVRPRPRTAHRAPRRTPHPPRVGPTRAPHGRLHHQSPRPVR